MSNVLKRLEALEENARYKSETKDIVNQIDIYEHIAPIYHELHKDIISGTYQDFNLPGGRGSCKSSFIGIEIVNGIMQDDSGNSNAIVFRRTANTMRDSVYSQIAWAVDKLDVSELWSCSVSPMQFTYKPTGAQILFRGLDEAGKLKSIKPKKGYFRYIWFEEFNEIPGENFARSVTQSVIRGGDRFSVFRSFNPPISLNNWANTYVKRPNPKAKTLYTSYLDVPAEWLGENFIYEAERLKAVNERAYRHEYLGEAIGSGGEVFPNIEARTITDEEINELQYFYAGVDFGFAVDPAVFMRLAYDKKKETVYLLDEVYKKHISNRDLANIIKENHLQYAGDLTQFDSEKFYRDEINIICDSAEPKSIVDLRQEDLRAFKCYKKPGCVAYRIKWLQSRQIVIDPQRTPHAYKEFTEYEYLTTKDGEFLSDVPDKDNHCIDAVFYGLTQPIFKEFGNPA